MKVKSLCVMVLLLVSLLAVSGVASAAVTINSVEVDDTEFSVAGGVITIDVDKDNELEVKIVATSIVDEDDVQMSAYIRGNRKDLIEDITDIFDMKAGVSYSKKLTLDLPSRMTQNTYTLYIRVENNAGQLQDQMTFSLDIGAVNNDLDIKDVVLSPENYVKAGRALLTTVRLKNRGALDQEDIKVKVSMPELGISASDYIDELDAECNDSDNDCDDSTTSEELYLRIPDCAEPGIYTVKVCVEYDDGDEEDCEITEIEVTEGDLCPAKVEPECPIPGCGVPSESKTIITIGPEEQEIEAGKTAVYSVTLTNQGTGSKSYAVSVDAGDWADVSVAPTNVVVLSAGESKSVFVNVEAVEAGEQMLAVTISSGDKVLKQVPLKASVEEVSASGISSIKRGLEIGLVILVVLLVILGLIIGFNKLRSSDEDEDKEEQTYY